MYIIQKNSLKQLAKSLGVDLLRRTFARVKNQGSLPLAWCQGPNWGDALSPVLAGLLSGKPVIHLDGLHHDRYLAIGSILGSANESAEVWGSGFIQANARVLGRPRVVHAVRGPLSRAALLEQGIECPEIYGDPALLLPRFFNPEVPKIYPVGIIPHYIDKKHPWLEMQRRNPEVLILDIESGIQEFVRAVKSCEVVLSSSLHGLVCADAYAVSNVWVQFSDAVIGGDFKFRDYRLSIGAGEPSSRRISTATQLSELVAKAEAHPLKIDLRKLILACPFLGNDLRHEVNAAGYELPSMFVSRRLGSELMGDC